MLLLTLPTLPTRIPAFIQAGCCVELAQVVAVHSNNKNNCNSSQTSSSSDHHPHRANSATASRLRLLYLLLETACAFLHTPNGGGSSSDAVAVPDLLVDSEAWTAASAMDREALVAAGMGEADVLVAETQTTTTTTVDCRETGSEGESLRLLALCCRVVTLLAGPPSGSSSRSSSRFLYPPAATTQHQRCDHDNDNEDLHDEEASSAAVNLTPTLSSLGLLATPTSTSAPQPRWEGLPSGHSMGLEPFSTRLFQEDLRKTLIGLQAAAANGSGAAAAAYRLRASGCCETIVQVTDRLTAPSPLPFLATISLYL